MEALAAGSMSHPRLQAQVQVLGRRANRDLSEGSLCGVFVVGSR